MSLVTVCHNNSFLFALIIFKGVRVRKLVFLTHVDERAPASCNQNPLNDCLWVARRCV